MASSFHCTYRDDSLKVTSSLCLLSAKAPGGLMRQRNVIYGSPRSPLLHRGSIGSTVADSIGWVDHSLPWTVLCWQKKVHGQSRAWLYLSYRVHSTLTVALWVLTGLSQLESLYNSFIVKTLNKADLFLANLLISIQEELFTVYIKYNCLSLSFGQSSVHLKNWKVILPFPFTPPIPNSPPPPQSVLALTENWFMDYELKCHWSRTVNSCLINPLHVLLLSAAFHVSQPEAECIAFRPGPAVMSARQITSAVC